MTASANELSTLPRQRFYALAAISIQTCAMHI